MTVLNNHDGGAGSLRDAIGRAKSGDTIAFAPSLVGQTITLTSDELAIKNSLDIEGPGADKLAISGGDKLRVFDLGEGSNVTIAGLTITRGKANASRWDNGGSGGGGIRNGGSLTLVNDVFSENQSETHGGAIADGPHSVLTVRDSLFTGNRAFAKSTSAQVEGGAIWNGLDGCTATIIDSTFVGNRVVGGDGGGGGNVGESDGGALHNDGTSILSVRGCTFIGNQSIGGNGASGGKLAGPLIMDFGNGGAIANDGTGILNVDGCMFSGNQAIGGSGATGTSRGESRIGHAFGGAIATEGVAVVTNSTFDHNDAIGGDNNAGSSGDLIIGRGAGGAIGNLVVPFTGSQAALTVANCTFSGNRALGGAGNTGGTFAGDGLGGALLNERGGTAEVTGSIFTGNQAIGGQGAPGRRSGDALGGALVNLFGSTLNVSGCTLTGNQAVGGSGFNGGNGLGGGLFNDGLSEFPSNVGTPATLMVLGSTITDNMAIGGAAVGGATAGLGEGGGLYLAPGGVACLDAFTQGHTKNNKATTDHDDIFGSFTTC